MFKVKKSKQDPDVFVTITPMSDKRELIIADIGSVKYRRSQRKQVAKRLQVAAKLVLETE